MLSILTDLFTRNVGLKLLSLAMAVLLWYMAVGRERGEVGMTVPLELINIPANMVVVNELPDGISLRLRGSLALTRQVAERRLRFSLDMSGARKGENRFTLQPDTLGLPGEMEVIRVAPNTVVVQLESLIIKTLNLMPVIKGEPVAGYIIEGITLEPQKLDVRGPESIMNRLEVLWTDPINVTTFSASTTVQTRPALPEPGLTVVKPTTIQARLKIGDKIISRDFKDLSVEALIAPDEVIGFELTPATVALTIRGPLNALTNLVPGEDLHVRVNLTGLDAGRHERMLIVTVPPSMEVVRVEPKFISVDIFEGIPKKE